MATIPALESLLERATTLALRGTGKVEPNPRVGALLVKDGHVIAEGWHHEYGGPHAEIVALQAAGGAARGADLIITLEPCCTTGKTPPCTEAIKAAGVRRVYFASEDPNPIHRGKAKIALAPAGIEVHQIGANAIGDALLAPFRRYLDGVLPWTVLKWAMSADGKVATVSGDSRWISSEASRGEVHAERARADAVLVGRATVKVDDPMLNVRLGASLRRQPVRVVLDSGLHLDPEARVVQTAREMPTWVIHAAGKESSERRDALEREGVRLIGVPEGEGNRLDLAEALAILRKEGLHRILVEGGPTVHGAFINHGLGSYARIYVAPLLIGGITAPSPVAGQGFRTLQDAVWLDDVHLRIVGEGGSDLAMEGRLRNFIEAPFSENG